MIGLFLTLDLEGIAPLCPSHTFVYEGQSHRLSKKIICTYFAIFEMILLYRKAHLSINRIFEKLITNQTLKSLFFTV